MVGPPHHHHIITVFLCRGLYWTDQTRQDSCASLWRSRQDTHAFEPDKNRLTSHNFLFGYLSKLHQYLLSVTFLSLTSSMLLSCHAVSRRTERAQGTLPPPAKPVPDSYWECIKHKKRPANTTQMSYHVRLANDLVTTQEQTKRQRKDDGALTTVTYLNTTSLYPCVHPMPPTPTSQAANVYGLPSVSALVPLHHVSAVNPVPSTWFAAIKAGNYDTFCSLTLYNAMKHCHSSDATIKGHLKQTRQGLHSTMPKSHSSSNCLL